MGYMIYHDTDAALREAEEVLAIRVGETLDAENARLRAALTEIHTICDEMPEHRWQRMRQWAALNLKERP